MSRLDRYLLTELVPPFLFGVGAFLAILLGVNALYEMLKLIFRMGFPVSSALMIFVLKLPGSITLTLPMAMMFGSLMSMSRLSGDGELVALRAGGAGMARIGTPVILVGLLVSVSALAINELIVPPFEDQAYTISRQAYQTAASEGDLAFEVRDADGKMERWLYGKTFDAATMTVTDALIVDFTRGETPVVYRAGSVSWQGDSWVLEKGDYTQWDRGRSIQMVVEKTTVPVGGTPDELDRVTKKPAEMSLGELAQSAAEAMERGNQTRAGRLLQHKQMRLALPWSSLGFALLGLPLGIRRTRSSRGIGMGLSLVVIFVYYAITHTLGIVGERGMAHHAIIAWTPNILLYLAGIGLMLRSSNS